MQRTNQGIERTGRTDIFDRGSTAPRLSTGSMLRFVKPCLVSDFESVLLAIAAHNLRQPLQVVDFAFPIGEAAFQRDDLSVGPVYEVWDETDDRFALVNDTSETSQLVGLCALIGRMRISSSDNVIEAAEKTGNLMIETYLSPNKTFVDLPAVLDGMDPLRDFSEASRPELQATRGR